MGYWRRPKFWFVLFFAEGAAFLISGLFATLCETVIEIVRHSHFRQGHLSDIIAITVNTYLAYDAFCFARNSVPRPPEPRGFPVVMADGDDHSDCQSV